MLATALPKMASCTTLFTPWLLGVLRDGHNPLATEKFVVIIFFPSPRLWSSWWLERTFFKKYLSLLCRLTFRHTSTQIVFSIFKVKFTPGFALTPIPQTKSGCLGQIVSLLGKYFLAHLPTRDDWQQRFLAQECCNIVAALFWIVTNSYNIVPTLQRCVALKLVVVNHTM